MSEPTWGEIVAPIARKCTLAAKFNQSVCWNAEGAAAMAKLLTVMADTLDGVIERIRRTNDQAKKARKAD